MVGDCISWCNAVIKSVDTLPDLDHATRNHIYITPDNKPYILNNDGTGFLVLNEGQASVAYDDKPLIKRIESLESKEDKDTIYNDTEVKKRIEALEDKQDKDTVYNDSELRGLISNLQEELEGSEHTKIEFTDKVVALSHAPTNLQGLQVLKWVGENYKVLWGQNFGNVKSTNPQNIVPTGISIDKSGTDKAPVYNINAIPQPNTVGNLRYLGHYNINGDASVKTLSGYSEGSVVGQQIKVTVEDELNANGIYYFGTNIEGMGSLVLDAVSTNRPIGNTVVIVEGISSDRVLMSYNLGNYGVWALKLDKGKTYNLTLRTEARNDI